MGFSDLGLRRAMPGAATAVCILALGGQALAGESSATNFPVGVNTALSALYPPPGETEYYNYMLLYTASAYPTTANNPKLPPYETNVYVEAFRINHTWLAITDDITFGSGMAQNLVRQTLDVPGAHFDGGWQYADPDFIPYNIGFHVLPDLWIAHIFNIFTDWGQYSKNDVINGGVGYYTFSPELAATWMNDKVEVSLDAHYDFNRKNTATDYQSGNSFDVDYVAGYRPVDSLPGLQLGVSGYVFKQVEDDTQYGAVVGNGNKGQALGIGPSIRYDIGHGGLILKWQHEFDVENRTRGERIWFQFAIPL